MSAVFRHEMASYFSGLSAFVFGTFVLLFGGIYTMAYNIVGGFANFEFVMNAISFIFIIIVPIITMRVLAEEKRQKTDQLLYSLPISMTNVVLGKFLAMLIVFAIPVGILCIYPVILSRFGNVSFAASYSAVLGFFLLGASLLAIGMFISSLTESQAVAAGICFVVMLLNYFIASISDYVPTTPISSFIAFTVIIIIIALIFRFMTKSNYASIFLGAALEIILLILYLLKGGLFEGLFANAIGKLSLFERFYVFIDGVFDLTGIVYFVSIIALFLFLSIQSMEKRRWSE